VNYSDLEDRLNAEYYHPKYDQVQRQLEEVDAVVTIRDILDPDESKPLINGKDISGLSSTGKRQYVEEGTPYLRAGDVKRNEIDIHGSNKVRYTQQDLKENRWLQVGDLLFSRKGTTGRVSTVTEQEVDSIISSEVMKIRLRKAVMTSDGEMRKVDPFYISAYLNSRSGRSQIERHLTGSISQGINQPDLKSVKIPLPSEDEQKG
jgi:type I restriction enzyme M protein